MKSLKVLLICGAMIMSGQSFANTVPIKFAKGSYCGSFSGDYAGRTFTIYLNKGQTLRISGADGVENVIVKSPNGKVLHHEGQDYAEWTTRMKGKHAIKLIPYDRNDTYTSIEFCAY